MEETITYVGLDVHKKSIAVAVANGGLADEVRYLGLIDGFRGHVTYLMGRLWRVPKACHVFDIGLMEPQDQ